jgi:hypothetical protein
LREEFFAQYSGDVLFSLMKGIDALCLDDSGIGLVFSETPIGLGGSAVCYQYHGYQ